MNRVTVLINLLERVFRLHSDTCDHSFGSFVWRQFGSSHCCINANPKEVLLFCGFEPTAAPGAATSRWGPSDSNHYEKKKKILLNFLFTEFLSKVLSDN